MFPHLISAIAQKTNPRRILWFSPRHARLFKKDVKTGSNKEMCDIHHNTLFSFVLCNRTSRILTLTVGVTSHTHPTHTHRYTTPPPVCGHWPDLPGWQAWPCIWISSSSSPWEPKKIPAPPLCLDLESIENKRDKQTDRSRSDTSFYIVIFNK